MCNREWRAKVVTCVNCNRMIGPSGEPIARNGLYRRGTKSVVTSPGSPGGPARLFLSISRRLPFFPLAARSSPFSTFLLPSHPSIPAAGCVRVTHTRTNSSFAGTIRVVSVRAEACKQVRWMHSVHSTGFSSSSSITRRSLLHLLRACPSFASLSLSLPHPHILSTFSVYVSSCLALFLPFSLVSFSYFGARCNRAFSMKTYGFLSEESSPAIVLLGAADDRNFASETRRRTISRITISPSLVTKLLALDNVCPWRVLSIFKRRQQIMVHFPRGYRLRNE